MYPSVPLEGAVILIWPIIGYVDFDYLVKAESTGFLHCKVTIFFFVVYK